MSSFGLYNPFCGHSTFAIIVPVDLTTLPPPPGSSPSSILPTPTTTSNPPPASPSILIIWDVPPKTGPSFYDFYSVDPNFDGNLDTQCGATLPDISPFSEINDPKLGRVDNLRKSGDSLDPSQRTPPGDLGDLGFFSNHCHYVEDELGKANLNCDNNLSIPCHQPDDELSSKVTPNNGECSNIKNVRMLVTVSPLLPPWLSFSFWPSISDSCFNI
jgi:hypothetical protein